MIFLLAPYQNKSLRWQQVYLAARSLNRFDSATPDQLKILGLLKEIIESTYTDGIDAIKSYSLDPKGDIKVIFRDGQKIYTCLITDDRISYHEIQPNAPKLDSLSVPEYRFDVVGVPHAPKKKNCTKGDACGFTCVKKGTCKKGLTSEIKPKVKEAKAEIKAEMTGRGKPELSQKEKIEQIQKKKEARDKAKGYAYKKPEESTTPIQEQSKPAREKVTKPAIKENADHIPTTKKLGEGAYGEVGLTKDGTAYKKFKELGKSDEPKQISNEIAALKELAAIGVTPHVLSVTKDKGGDLIGYEMEYLNGFETKNRMAQILGASDAMKAVAKMHVAGWLHNDLHLGNMLVNPKTGEARVIDTGLAIRMGKKEEGHHYSLYSEVERFLDAEKESFPSPQNKKILAVMSEFKKQSDDLAAQKVKDMSPSKIKGDYRQFINDLDKKYNPEYKKLIDNYQAGLTKAIA